MVSALVSGSSGPGSSPGRGHCVVFLGKTVNSVPLSTQGYKWVPANLMLGVVTSCYGNRDKLRPDGPLGSYADLTLPLVWTVSLTDGVFS